MLNKNSKLELFRTKTLASHSIQILSIEGKSNCYQAIVDQAFIPSLQVDERLVLRELMPHQNRLKARVTQIQSDQAFELEILEETKEDLRAYPRMLINLSMGVYVLEQKQALGLKPLIDAQQHDLLSLKLKEANLTRYEVSEDLLNFSIGGLQFEASLFPISADQSLLCDLKIKAESFFMLADMIRMEKIQDHCYRYAIQWIDYPRTINEKFSEITLAYQNSILEISTASKTKA